MTFGYSRDDVGKFLPIYLSEGILQSDPFEVKLFRKYLIIRFMSRHNRQYGKFLCLGTSNSMIIFHLIVKYDLDFGIKMKKNCLSCELGTG